jgi:translation initiation factor 5
LSAENGDKDYLKEAMFGKKEEDDFGSDDDDDSAATETGVDDLGARQLAVDAVRKFLDEKPDASVAELVEVVTNQQMASALKSQDKIYIILTAAITKDFIKKKEVTKYSPAIHKITNGNKIMERHMIAALEALSIEKPKHFPVLIKQFYDEDSLAEETILEWADAGRTEYTLEAVDEESRAALRGEAEPVVVWLQEADSEEDSDEED